jgi:hypothetical protein
VDRKDPAAILEKGRELLGSHALFIDWGDAGDERELRCTMRWSGDDSITALLHVFSETPANVGVSAFRRSPRSDARDSNMTRFPRWRTAQ